MDEPQPRYYEFGRFRVDATRRLLFEDGEPRAITPKAFDLLVELLEAGGDVVDRDRIMGRVWPGVIVEDKNITVTVSALRKALGENPQEHRYIVTVPGKGYRFVAPVTISRDEEIDVVYETSRSVIVVEEDALEEKPIGLPPASALAPLGLPARPARFRWLAASLTVVVLAVAVAVLYFATRPSTHAPIRSVAVLPFKPLVLAERDESLELGMADTLITRLASVHDLTVRPISAVRRYTAEDQDPVAAGRELRVEGVLEGSIQRAGERLRITVRLLRVADGTAVWSATLDEKTADIFALQDSIAERVARALVVEVSADDRRLLAKRPAANPEAYEAYLKGRYFLDKRTRQSFDTSVGYFSRAIERDPEYAPAYAGLADAYYEMVYWSESPPGDYMPKAKAAAERALTLDETLAEAHTSLAIVLEDYEWRFAEAERQYRRAIDLNPGYALAHQRYGQFLAEIGRFDEARAEHLRALEIDPLSLNVNMSLGALYYLSRRYDEAVEQLRKTVELDPSYYEARGLLGVVYKEKGMYDEAVAAWTFGMSPEAAAPLRKAYEEGGITAYYLKDVEMTRQRFEDGQPLPIYTAMQYAYLGRKDEAFAILERAFEDRHGWLGELRVEPAWDNLRSDPRFDDLVRRVGLGG